MSNQEQDDLEKKIGSAGCEMIYEMTQKLELTLQEQILTTMYTMLGGLDALRIRAPELYPEMRKFVLDGVEKQLHE